MSSVRCQDMNQNLLESDIPFDGDERVIEEIEALQAIMMDEILVKRNENGWPIQVEAKLHPATGDDEEQKYVCVNLVLDLPPGYPDCSPEVMLRNPRGLDDDILNRVKSECALKCEDHRGNPVLYELIELVKEHLTHSNLPTGECAICLFGFSERDAFTRTGCYHYFHSHCLARYIQSVLESHKEETSQMPAWQQQNGAQECQVMCAVCREPIEYDLDALLAASPPHGIEIATDFTVTEELRQLNKKMAQLFLYQKKKGGIIDIEAEGNKLLLVTESAQRPDHPGQESVSVCSNSDLQSTDIPRLMKPLSGSVPSVSVNSTNPSFSSTPVVPGFRSWRRGGSNPPRRGRGIYHAQESSPPRHYQNDGTNRYDQNQSVGRGSSGAKQTYHRGRSGRPRRGTHYRYPPSSSSSAAESSGPRDTYYKRSPFAPHIPQPPIPSAPSAQTS